MDSDYGLVDSFGIDHGELDGLSLVQCFVLGVEWQMVAAQADKSDGFERPVHSDNRTRVEALLDRRNRQYRITHMHDDRSESWLWLSVAPC